MSKHEKLLFDRIATPYGLFYQVQKKKYTRIFEILKKKISMDFHVFVMLDVVQEHLLRPQQNISIKFMLVMLLV